MSEKVAKILYAKSGGVCAICKVSIVSKTSAGSPFHISEICHIQGKGRKALRHNPEMSVKEMDDYSNLIVLCANCHKEVDNNEIDFFVEKLHEIKKDHEKWVRVCIETEEGKENLPLFGIRKKYLELISDTIISQPFFESSSLLSKFNKKEFPDFSDSYDTGHVPNGFVIMDDFFTYIFEREQDDRKGVWIKRLIGFLNSEIMWLSSDKQQELITAIPPREIEKAGFTFSEDMINLFKLCRPRSNNDNSSPLFSDSDIRWFCSLLKDPLIQSDLRDCSIVHGKRGFARELKDNSSLDIPYFIVQRFVETHQANRLLYILYCVKGKHVTHDQLKFAIMVLKEAIEDWGPRIQEIVTRVRVA